MSAEFSTLALEDEQPPVTDLNRPHNHLLVHQRLRELCEQDPLLEWLMVQHKLPIFF